MAKTTCTQWIHREPGAINRIFHRTGILAGVLFLCLALTACSQQEPASSDVKKQPSTKDAVSDTAKRPPEGASTGSAVSPSEPSSPKIGARPAVIEKVSLEPKFPVTGDSLRADVLAKDPAGNPVQLLYRWKVDGHLVQESGETVLNYSLQSGSLVELEVIAADETATLDPVRSSTFIGNAPPTVRLSGQTVGSDNTYRASLEAADPEGGPVTFSLRRGPSGMTVDPATGSVQWAVGTGETGGSHEIEIAARDREGLEAVLNYRIQTRMEPGDGMISHGDNATATN